MLFHVHRAPLPLCLQFSRRRFPARELSCSLRQSENAGDGTARSRRRLWLSAFPHGGEESENQGAYWSRGNMRTVFTTETQSHRESESQINRFLCVGACPERSRRVSPWWISSSPSRFFPHRISESLPPDYENEAALSRRRRLSARRRTARTCHRTRLPYRRRQRAAGSCPRSWWSRRSSRVRRATNKHFWP